MILPGDLKPHPVHASGMMALRESAIGGYALTLKKPSNGTTADFSFGVDGKLPVAAIDAFRAGETVRVIQRADQMRGVPGFLTDYLSDVTFGPKFAALGIGAHRCMYMEGDCQVENVTFQGQPYFLRADNVGPLGIKQNDMTMMQVLMLHNSAFCYQGQAPSVARGCTFAMSAAEPGGTHTRVFAESNVAGNPFATGGGGYTAEDGLGYRGFSFNAWMESDPIVLTYINGPNGTWFGQNEDFRSITAHSFNSRVGVQAFIGAHEGWVPATVPPNPPPPLNETMGGAELCTLIWNRALTLRQAASFAASLYALVPVDHRHSHSNSPLVVGMTDSIYAGYKGDDLREWQNRAMLQLPGYVRWGNFAVPGSSIVPNPAADPRFLNPFTLGLFPGWIAQAIRQHKGRVHCVWGTPGNDSAYATPDEAYNNGTLALIDLVRGIDPSATITLCTGTRSSNTPFDDYLGAGSVLIRNGAAAHGYGVVEVRNDPVMGIKPPGAGDGTYKDGGHLTNAGWDRMATLITPRIQTWLSTLGYVAP